MTWTRSAANQDAKANLLPRSGAPASDPVHENPDVWAPRLSRILERQQQLYEQLEMMGADQRRVIDAGQTDLLLEILGRRQQVIDQIATTNDEVLPFSKSWDRLAPMLSEQQRTLLRERFDRVATAVERICRRDESDRQALEAQRRRVGEEVAQLARAQDAVAAYGRPADSSARFEDRQA